MRIVVCGCSFNTPTVKGYFENTHWSQILANKLDAELITLAKPGVSNNIIRLQISDAIKYNPDWIFINATSTDRVEIPTDNNNISDPNLGYNIRLGLENLNYDNDPRLISDTIFSIVDWEDRPYRKYAVNADARKAVENYAAFMYDTFWKMQVDNWVINSGLWQLHDLGYKFIYNQTIINEHQQYHMLPEWFVKKYLVSDRLNLLALMRENFGQIDPGYHTSTQSQIWLAERYLELMQIKEKYYKENNK